MHLIVNTDGASRGNPGRASYGFVIKNQDGVILHQEGQIIGYSTNNVAEYTAVLRSLEYIKNHYKHKTPHSIQIISDSKLIIEQLKGNFKIKSPNLKFFFEAIKKIEIELGQINYLHVARKHNFLADKLANLALDK